MSEQFQASVSAVTTATDPVFVLCAGRSGSTLLRFLLDAHPDLACPPETNVPALCGQLATVWSLIEGAPLSANRGDEPPEIPDAAIVGVRETMNRMTGSYLARRGKKRYCDKSLGTARFAYLLTRIWPEAKFICLFRHPMDVIASGIEACPWGLNGYGFDQYIAETPGNAVWALARFWADNVGVILAAENEYKDRCFRLRYEDVVADPQAVADALFAFLGVPLVPDIGMRAFAPERERFGPADYKIWQTSRITNDSVGRGWTIPAGLIAPPVRNHINELCGMLGYLPVDDDWGTAELPADLRLPADGEQAGPDVAAVSRTVPLAPSAVPLLARQLAAGVSEIGDGFISRWEPCATESFTVVATPSVGPGPEARWEVDLTARTLTQVDGTQSEPDDDADGDEDAAEETGWDIIGSADTWEQVVAGRLNLSVALRRNQLRYCETGGTGPVVAEARVRKVRELLGLTSWGQARLAQQPGSADSAAARPAESAEPAEVAGP